MIIDSSQARRDGRRIQTGAKAGSYTELLYLNIGYDGAAKASEGVAGGRR